MNLLRFWPAIITLVVIVGYFAFFRWRYCTLEHNCTHPADWWFHTTDEAQAAWIQGIGSILAIISAAAVVVWQRRSEAMDRQRENRLRAMHLASSLNGALRTAQIFFEFDVIDPSAMTKHDMASAWMLPAKAIDAIKAANECRHLFGSPMADALVTLAEQVESYHSILLMLPTRHNLVDSTAIQIEAKRHIAPLGVTMNFLRRRLAPFLPAMPQESQRA